MKGHRDPQGASRSGLSIQARSAAKKALRAYGVASSRLRRLPDFMIIGGKRCGTTSLHNYLVEHPRVAPLFPAPQKIKGVHYFDSNFHRGRAWYRSHFATYLTATPLARRTIGEASPYYLFHPHAAGRARDLVPSVRLIVLLRNPVDRAYSHYRERCRHGVETLSFEEAIEREEERLQGEEERMLLDASYYSFNHEHLSYLAQGYYARSLARWTGLFDHGQFLLLPSEDFFRDPRITYKKVLDFLGLSAFTPPSFDRYNFHPGSAMHAATRERLIQHVRPWNEELAEMVGFDLSEWAT